MINVIQFLLTKMVAIGLSGVNRLIVAVIWLEDIKLKKKQFVSRRQKMPNSKNIETEQTTNNIQSEEMPNLCNICTSRGIPDCNLEQGSISCFKYLVGHFSRL